MFVADGVSVSVQKRAERTHMVRVSQSIETTYETAWFVFAPPHARPTTSSIHIVDLRNRQSLVACI